MDSVTLIKTELFKNLDSFVNELSLTMDYLSPQLIKKIEDYIVKLKNNNKLFQEFISVTNSNLNTFEVKFSGALFSNKKVKSNYYDFLSQITLFDCLEFKVFKDESKATKKAFVSYLYNIYFSCLFLVKFESGESEEQLSKELTDFVQKIKTEAETAISTEFEKVEKVKKIEGRRNAISGPSLDENFPELSQFLPGVNLPGMTGGFGDIMSSILGNQQILDIASDISHQMQTQQLNPMMMLSSLMSGDITNSPLNGLVTQIQEKVEMKINSGEIDKSVLENQAQSIMDNLGGTLNPENLNSIPGMSSMMQTMAENLQKQAQEQAHEHQEQEAKEQAQ